MASPHINQIPPHEIVLDFVYQDDFLLVVNKPAELLAVPGRGLDKADNLTSRVQKEFPDALSVHRLDMSTSGLLILARGKEMHSRLSQLFRDRSVKKCYTALVAGRKMSNQGTVDLPLGPDWLNRPRQKVDFANGKNSLTRYSLLAHDPAAGISRVALEPVTGRTHQLRVHMAAIGQPILGDPLYGHKLATSTGRMMLHARMLSFIHPFSMEPLTVVSEAPF
ncbi:MAG: RluA family pseudouridine synthase [Gallionella sp.]